MTIINLLQRLDVNFILFSENRVKINLIDLVNKVLINNNLAIISTMVYNDISKKKQIFIWYADIVD
jgi:hypothetical protein